MADTKTVIIDALSVAESSQLCISQFSNNFDTVKFRIPDTLDGYTLMIVADIEGSPVIFETDGTNLYTEKNQTTGQTHLVWRPGREITCTDGIVVYQIAAYKTQNNEIISTWYSAEGRIIVSDSIDTTAYSSALIGSHPDLVTRLILETDKIRLLTNSLESDKVDKESGKGLSQNDFTNLLKNKLDGIEDEAQKNVQSDWDISDTSSDAYIKNKPTIDMSYSGNSKNAQSGTAVAQAIAQLVGSAPDTLNTLEELADALKDNANIVDVLNEAIAGKADKINGHGLVSLGVVNSEDVNKRCYVLRSKNSDNIGSGWTIEVYSKSAIDYNLNLLKDNINGKADKTTVTDSLALKVDKVEGYGLSYASVLDGKILIGFHETNGLGNHAHLFYDAFAIDDNLNLLKDNINGKADKTTVTDSLALKVDKLSGFGLANVQTGVNDITIQIRKEDGYTYVFPIYNKEYIDSSLSTKVGEAELNDMLFFKADSIDLETLKDGLQSGEFVVNSADNANWATRAGSSNNAILADNATNDSYGNQIDKTYATKEELRPTPLTSITGTLSPNQPYHLSEPPSSIAFPSSDVEDGDTIYVTFITGETAPTVTIDTTNTTDIDISIDANTGYEIYGKYVANIGKWIVGCSEYTVTDGDEA